MANKDRNTKNQENLHADARMKNNRGERRSEDHETGGESYRSTDLHSSPMMAHLLDALEQGQDIGEYGRLTFVMVARHFLNDDEMLSLMAGQPDLEEKDIRAMITQVKERDYSPPKRERILQWMERQDFPICPDADDPNACNVYRELQFPDRIYEQINEFWEEKAGE